MDRARAIRLQEESRAHLSKAYDLTKELIGLDGLKDEILNECDSCIHRREVPGNCHIQCAKPDANMTGNEHGIRKGWFMYPMLFDPVWKTKLCANYETPSTVSLAISQPVSRETE